MRALPDALLTGDTADRTGPVGRFQSRPITSGAAEDKDGAPEARKQASVAGILGDAPGAVLHPTEEDLGTSFEPAGG